MASGVAGIWSRGCEAYSDSVHFLRASGKWLAGEWLVTRAGVGMPGRGCTGDGDGMQAVIAMQSTKSMPATYALLAMLAGMVVWVKCRRTSLISPSIRKFTLMQCVRAAIGIGVGRWRGDAASRVVESQPNALAPAGRAKWITRLGRAEWQIKCDASMLARRLGERSGGGTKQWLSVETRARRG